MDDLHDDLAAHVADELASADGGQPAPLSDERLAKMRDRVEYAYQLHMDDRSHADAAYPDIFHDYTCDVEALLAELDRKNRVLDAARNLWLADRERLLALARAVAEVKATNGSDPDDMRWPCCAFSSACEPVWSEHFIEWRHAVDCPVTQARAALAAADAPGERA